MTCWKCHEAVEGPACVSCGSLQPPPPKPDLFEVLGLSRTWAMDRKDIDRAWRARSRQTHPDRFAGQGALQKRMALQWTATLNEARRVLRDRVTRAWYLSTGAARAPEKGGPVSDQAFLEEVFELQMDAQMGEDITTRAEALLQTVDHELDGLFVAWETGDATLDAVPDVLARRKYIHNILVPH
jgi:curved DNA-binding protein CbpA